MAVRPVVIYPDPRLRAPTQSVLLPTSAQIRSLIADLIDTMYAKDGIGIAAPQIGVPAKLFIVDLASMPEQDFVYFNTSLRIVLKPQAFINPILVLEGDDRVIAIEGCLSFPGVRLEIARGSQATIRATDAEGAEFEIAGRGLLARCMLHELDHINSRLMIDYVSHLKRQMVTKKL